MDGPARILVVDDDPDFLDSIRTMLTGSGYRVGVAPGEDEAIAEIEAEKPDLLILDVMMSRSDSGFHFAWRLKSDERYQAIPVLMVTAVDEQVGFDFARHVNAGHRTPEDQAYLPVDGHVMKPVKTVELLGAVERLLPRPAQQAGST